MPTENRSSNTEMVIFPRELSDDLAELIATRARVCGGGAFEIWEAICEGFAAPAPQPHAEPIAWMVGTAFWWTKEEAERDAAATGLPIVGLGSMSGAAPAGQRQGEPLPITNGMQRLMEACRMGEFKDEGGSETVEALAVESLDAKSSMGHDTDSYMAGYSAALYEQAEPFIWMSLYSQRQGEPIGYVCPKALDAAINGRIGAEQISILKTPYLYINKPLYTHSDPSEVERLRTMLDQTDADLRSVTADRDTLRAEADRLRQEVASIDKKLRGNVSDPDPLKPIMPGALSVTTTYGLVAGIVRERDQLKKALERQPS
nr:hypothetical protein [Pseudomonas juntendi]